MKIYCVGTAKSGTHSIAEIFARHFRAQHEPESTELARIILSTAAHQLDENAVRSYLIDRDQRLNLDVDSSQLNFFILSQLMDLFPTSKFILTIRNPYDWLDSFINHQLITNTPTTPWTQMREFRFRSDLHTHPIEESILKENNLYTLDGYLAYWSHHNNTVIDMIPKNRLLILRTEKISSSLDKIADFCSVSVNFLSAEKSHSFTAEQKFNFLKKLNSDYLNKKITEHCGALINQYFQDN